jgi:hypothetical protein
MRLSSSSVLGFSTFGALGPSPPPPGEDGGRGFCMRSGIRVIMSADEFCKFQSCQIVNGLGIVDDFQTLLNLHWIKKIA